MPKLPKLFGILSKIPGTSRISGLSVVSKIRGSITKISSAGVVAKMLPKLKLLNINRIPVIARIPLRTKLIFIGALVACLIFVPLILSIGQKGGEEAAAEETVVEELAEEPVEEIVEEVTEAPEEGPIEETETQPAEESTEKPLERPAVPEGIIEEIPPEPPPDPIIGGVLIEDTTWVKAESPYEMSSAVRIPAGITLTIEPGVTITKKEGAAIDCMFVLSGTLHAHGTDEDPIIFDGGGNSSFFVTKDGNPDTFVDMDHCEIKNGISFWNSYGNFGAFRVKQTLFTSLSDFSYIWYPHQDVRIEYCTFANTGGFSIEQRHNANVYIEYCLFTGKHRNLPDNEDYWIQNRGSYNTSKTIVRNNSFYPADGTALRLYGEAASITATENYWGTQDSEVIEEMIHDMDDDDTCGSVIEYHPILTSAP